ncbi:lipoyl synthase [Candidatus Poribacteria bacterium]|nr:lipoyl synthase [Candidatus Poribacteria bacterium]
MTRIPGWLRESLPNKKISDEMASLLKQFNLNTVCQSARCPNIGKCFSHKTATFMILGNICTRKCTFCAVKKGKPEKIQDNEPENIAKACSLLNIKHIVITSVTRDDLPDGGAGHFTRVIKEIKKINNKTIVEVLTPDFQGNIKSLEIITEAHPDIFNHNIETVPNLYPYIRPEANFDRSINLLINIKRINPDIYSKSGIMVGMGETEEQVYDVMERLRTANCDILTIGQYLQPTKTHYPVKEYITPDIFEKYKAKAIDMGFKYVASAPLVRSSFEAEEFSKNFIKHYQNDVCHSERMEIPW